VGRTLELTALVDALGQATIAVVHGAVGAGKTRLAQAVMRHPRMIEAFPSCYVRCSPGDRGAAVRARAERGLGALPGSLDDALSAQPRLLVIDDAHNLSSEDSERTFFNLGVESGAGKIILLTREVLPLRRQGALRFELNLEGLDPASARELWAHLEDTYGPTPKDACDEALARTRGLPLALRREYASAAVGDDAWEVESLAPETRCALEAIAVAGIPVAPAGVAALAPEVEAEQALIELVSRQLVDPIEDGRFAVHDVVRGEVLRAMDGHARRALERGAAELISSLGRPPQGGRRPAWEAGDDGALGLIDPIDRTREAVHHLLEAGELDAAVALLIEERAVALRRGAGGEIVALIERVEAAHGAPVRKLAALRAEIAMRHGRVAEAIVHAATEDPVVAAELTYYSGAVLEACSALEALRASDSQEHRSRAAALLAEIELDRGSAERARSVAQLAWERDGQAISDEARARLHMALAAIEERAGQFSAARGTLSRAASSERLDPVLSAQIEARRALCLAEEERLSEALRALAAAERLVCELDAVAVADEIRRCRALLNGFAGQLGAACDELRDLAYRRRERGDEIGALRAEVDLARLLERRGELSHAAELASACATAASRRTLDGLAARAELVSASIDVAELRLEEARRRLSFLSDATSADEVVRGAAAGLRAELDAGTRSDAAAAGRWHMQSILLLAAADPSAALDLARQRAVRAERAGKSAEMAEALALVARLQMARGERAAAGAAAERALREARQCGLTRAAVDGLIVLAALAREAGELGSATAYADEAAAMANQAGLPVQRLVAAQALDVIASGSGAASGDRVQSGAAATMSEAAVEAAAQMLADLGLTATRPYRVVGAGGEESLVADASPDLLRLEGRELAVDGVRELIVRGGKQVADLRRRSLLKRLLFLFSASPGKIFSKEEIVEKVWEVEYHPLRHDAALFTNIMRIRRLLGKDGADLIRVSEDGYRFCPPKDFLFVEAVAD
jgi:hypothetical protein